MGLLGRWQLSLLQSVRNERRGCLSARARSVARICTDAGRADTDLVIDAAGPETLTFDELVVLIRRATGAHALIVHVPPPIMRLAARALGLLVRDVVLTPDEIDGLMAGLLVSNTRRSERSASASGSTRAKHRSAGHTPTSSNVTSSASMTTADHP